jgi:hypothetical protein
MSSCKKALTLAYWARAKKIPNTINVTMYQPRKHDMARPIV